MEVFFVACLYGDNPIMLVTALPVFWWWPLVDAVVR